MPTLRLGAGFVVGEGERRKGYFASVARGMQPNRVRQSNQRAILTVLSGDPEGVSNADIARRTGLAPQTVSAVLDDLEKAGLLLRGQVRRGGGRGQPATPVYINPNGAFALGAEIGWTHIEVALTDLSGRVIDRRRESYSYPHAGTVFVTLARLAEELLRPLSSDGHSRVIGLGLAAPRGIGDPTALLKPPPEQIEAWKGVDFVHEAERATGFNTELVNDGNAACWAEFVAHSSPRPGNFAFLLIDTFVAAGIIAEDRLWEGVTGASANLGSMLVSDRQGKPRFVHEIASLFALGQQLDAAGATMGDATSDSPSGIAQAVVDAWIADAALALAQCLLNASTVLEFDFAAIEGDLPPTVLSRLVDAVSREISQGAKSGTDAAGGAARPSWTFWCGAGSGAAQDVPAVLLARAGAYGGRIGDSAMARRPC